ncbi:MAG: hypothetical protein GQ535_14565 [Rhodobacteraceae bacterium]|nr:hypothetical protein [Paracoccaceae bacterium]
MPYFDNYVSSVETAFSSCQIIAQLGLGLDGNEKNDEDGPILSMLRNTVNSDTRIPELGPRPSDQCSVYLAETLRIERPLEPPILQERLVLAINSNFSIQCEVLIVSERQPCVKEYMANNFSEIQKWLFEYLKSNHPKICQHGELRLYFTGKRFRIVLVVNSPYSEESLRTLASRLRLIQDIYLSPQTENRSHQIVDPSAFNYCQIDTSKAYSNYAEISSIYVDGNCNTFPNPRRDSTPP